MLRRPFGHTGVDVSVIGQGTWQLRDRRAAAEALRVGVDLGMTHVDTAELYRGSEEVVREAVGERRDELFLVSKVLPRNASYKGTLEACEASLRRLGTDRLDCYLLHWWSDEHPIEETMRAMGELVDRGLTRFVGVSNLDVHELEAARSALGRHRLACNQVLYHLEERGVEAEVLPWCKAHGLALVAYSPFGSTGGFVDPRTARGKTLADVARKLDKTPRQVALAFLTRDPCVFAIPKAERVAHVRDNAGGAFELPAWAVEELDRAFPMEPGLRFL
ncbi:MAG TPA: aldo/keto reductase [Candidatus Thermoplasmatota archaeon]|nr:aldo/keto reductase [Candidatus Thermoplasmatota archaeon]